MHTTVLLFHVLQTCRQFPARTTDTSAISRSIGGEEDWLYGPVVHC